MGQLAVTQDWPAIEIACAGGMSFQEAGEKFGVKPDTIRKRAKRNKWVLPKHAVEAVREAARGAVAKAATDWLAKGESHRDKVFSIATESLKGVKKVKVRNAKDLELVDKVGRRAAGLETAEIAQLTMIQLNERIDSYDEDDQPIEKPADATEVETEVTPVPSPQPEPSASPSEPAS
jgi:hypothetical protein